MEEEEAARKTEVVEEEIKSDITKPLILATVISSTACLQYGYNFWVLHFPAVVLMNFYNTTEEDMKSEDSLHQSILLILFFFAIALFPLGGLVGSFIFAPLADICGRKQTLMINNFLSMFCAVLMGFSKMVEAYEFAVFSRFLTGVSSGLTANIVPVYLTEIAPKNRRGAINVAASFFLIIGILIGQVFTVPQHLGNEKGWPILMSFAGFMALFQAIPLFYIPESPRYLMIQKRDEENARQVLINLKCEDDVEEEMEDLHQEDHTERAEKNMTILKLLHFPGLRRRFFIIFILMFSRQFAGYSAVYYYVDGIYLSTGLRRSMLHNLHIGTLACLIMISLLLMHYIDSIGRKILLLIGFGICSICCAVLPLTIHFQMYNNWLSYINTVLIILFLHGHFIGPGSIPPILVAEFFLQSSRASAFAAAGAMFWLSRFITIMTMGGIEATLKSYSFLIYLPVGLVTFLFIFKYVPETKQKSFREIRKILATQATKKIVVK